MEQACRHAGAKSCLLSQASVFLSTDGCMHKDDRFMIKGWFWRCGPICNGIRKQRTGKHTPLTMNANKIITDKYSTKRLLSTGTALITSFSLQCYFAMRKDWNKGPAANKPFDHLCYLKRKAERSPSLCKHPAKHLAQSNNRKQAHEHMSPSAPLQPFQRAPSTPWHSSASWQMSTGSPQWPQHPATTLETLAQGCSKGPICSAFGMPQISELNNHTRSWSEISGWKGISTEKKTLHQLGKTESFGRNAQVRMKC